MTPCLSIRAACLLAALGLPAGAAAPDALTPLGIKEVTINDGFWSPKIGLWRSVTINDTFDKFDQYGGFTNFDRVAQGLTGGHTGEPWWDGLIYETIRAGGDFLAANPDPVLKARVDGYIARIKAAAAHDADGYVNTAQQLENVGFKWQNPPAPGDMHDDDYPHTVYNAGCLVEAAIHYYHGTGDTELLKVATRMANYMCGIMGPPPKQNIIPGHAVSEETFVNLYQLYRDEPQLKATIGLPVNEQAYLDLAQFWIENRGNTVGRVSKGSYNQDDISVFLQPTLQGHAVRSALLASGMAVAGRENSRADYRQTVERWWQNMVDARMYVTGGLGAVAAHEGFGADYELPHDGYAETCAAVAGGFFSHNMNLLTGQAKYVDTLERELYNGALAGVSLQGDTYYYTNPMTSGPNHRRWEWAGAGLPLTPCCPPMFLKLNSALPSMIYATKGNTVYVNLYVGSQASIETAALDLDLAQITSYPWNGAMNFTVNPAAPSTFTMKFRIPGWASNPELRVNGQAVVPFVMESGYATVNRQWQAFFGNGLVRTLDDFGFQGEVPSHPELLDWLAITFVEGGWSMKKLHRLIVTSATYKQDSRVTPELLEKDPQNRLLARGPRLRIEAEMIRDLALSASGLLSEKLYGPSVRPPQPASVTEGAYGGMSWKVSEGEDRYRRGLYTFAKRSAPFASFMTFDAPTGEACVARREVSNTPLQSLVLLNDEVFVETARALGKKIAAHPGTAE
ncbi:MAG: DUF1553 domain-containing protein, partial [Verrucomicrobiaceae bacterium]